MMRRAPRTCLLALAVVATVASFRSTPAVAAVDSTAAPTAPPVPVSHVDLQRYVGLWHEIARIPNRFQTQCASDVTAEYEIDEDGRIHVTNSCAEDNGKISRASGIAKVVDTETNARLKVSFVSFLGVRPFWGDYWILGLGNDYEYAVIGTPNRKYGWILARRPDLDPDTMAEIWRIVEAQGYDAADFVQSTR